jgi:hypothetical protein
MQDIKAVIQRLVRRAKRRAEPKTVRLVEEPIIKLPDTYQAAALSLADKEAFKSYQVVNRMVFPSDVMTHPQIIQFAKAFQKELKKRDIPFYVFELYRSPERQNRLKAQGVSKAAGGDSPHQYGCAVDLVSATDFWALTRRQWAVIGAIGKEVARRKKIKIEWGGDWEFYDPAHWQIQSWRDYKEAYQQARIAGEELPEDPEQRFAILGDYLPVWSIHRKKPQLSASRPAS